MRNEIINVKQLNFNHFNQLGEHSKVLTFLETNDLKL